MEEKQETKELFTENVDINEKELLSLQYQCNPKQICQNTKTYVRTNMFLPIISVMRSNIGIENSVYYRHTDHLGTSNWITDTSGVAVQYLHYGPFGELLDEQSTTSYNERYRFTGKERDEESGYHYFGARYYTDHLGIWTSADPLLDKYPSISPYSYCSNNPLKFIDPDGRDVYVYDKETNKYFLYQETNKNFDEIRKFRYSKKQDKYVLRRSFIKIPKGIIQNGMFFYSNNFDGSIDGFTKYDILKFCMEMDAHLGVEICGYVYDNGQCIYLCSAIKNDKYHACVCKWDYEISTIDVYFFHTHGHAYSDDYYIPSNADKELKYKLQKKFNQMKFYIFSIYGSTEY